MIFCQVFFAMIHFLCLKMSYFNRDECRDIIVKQSCTNLCTTEGRTCPRPLLLELSCVWVDAPLFDTTGNFSIAMFTSDRFRLCPTDAVRHGEATHPGPGNTSRSMDNHYEAPVILAENTKNFDVTFAVANPTAIYQKTDLCCQLNSQVLLLSETSATSVVQRNEEYSFRRAGFKTVWGSPAPPQMSAGKSESLRGAAVGVSIHSQLPIRESMIADTSSWWTAGRIAHAFLKLPQVEIQLLVIYGFPANLPDSKNRTNQLLRHAVDRALQSTFPTIIAGDWNHHPESLDEFRFLQSKGYRSIEQLYLEKYGEVMPCTFKNATRNDVAVISPSLVKLVSSIHVDKRQLFAGHNPLVFTLTIPGEPLCKQQCRFPDSWLSYQPDQKLVADCYTFSVEKLPPESFDAQQPDIQVDHALTRWSQAVEKAVSAAISFQHQSDPEKFPMSKLPCSSRGRCKPMKVVQTPFSRTISKAWDGQYTPAIDKAPMKLRQQTRQLRRIQSLNQRLQKWQCRKLPPEVFVQLMDEWFAILNSSGFPMGFLKWTRQFPELSEISVEFPIYEELQVIEQFLRFDLDKQVYNINKKADQHVKFIRAKDIAKGKKGAFKTIREPSPGLVTQILHQKEYHANLLPDSGHGLLSMQLQNHDDFDTESQIQVNGQEVQVVDWRPPILDVMQIDAMEITETNVKVTQSKIIVEPRQVATELGLFWDKFWNANSSQSITDIDQWPEFLNLVANMPSSTLDIKPYSIDLWLQAIADIKSNTARGVCGWFADELKDLPLVVITDLVEIIKKIGTKGLPGFLMHAKTIPLAKEHHTKLVNKTRPITVLSLIYRVWGRVISRQILQQWTKSFPPAICGFLPKRSSIDLLYHLQSKLEQVHLGVDEQQWAGVTMDLVKCFNCLPRLPCKILMEKLGIPTDLIEFWFSSINRLERWWLIDNQLFSTGHNTTGCPEGDSFSVIAMLTINFLWTHFHHEVPGLLNAFADNWSYATTRVDQHIQVLGTIVRVTQALNLTIDWQKTWRWATSPEHKEILHRVQQQLSPQANPLQMVTHARELGYILHYKCNPSRASHKVRHQEVLIRLKKLQKQDLPIDIKAQIARASCLTKAFYGAELYATGERFFTEVRTGIARALLGEHHNIQTHVACACLSKYVEDPELFVIKHAIKKARNYLQQAGSEEFKKFMKVVTQFRHRPSQIIGPAAAFQFYLSKIGIQCDQQGQLSIGAFFTLNLCNSNLEDIFMAVDEAWMENVSTALHTRKGCQFTPQIDHVLTAKIFASLPEEQKITVGLDIVGGFMTNGQKRQFTDMEENCQFCGQTDSVEHRVMQCPATQCIRSNYPDVVEFLQSHDHIHLLVPVIFRSPQWEFDRQIRFQMTHQLEKEPDFQLSRVFTDGSSLLPTDVRYRWATFAIVTQIVPDDELITMVNLSPEELLEQAFNILDVGLCPGTPTVPRSELLAAVLSHEMAPNAQVVTDSAYVISCFQHVQQSPQWQLLHEHRNFDLLKRWWFSIHESGGIPTVLKVKAHEEISPNDFPQAILQIGNRAADSAAKTAAKHLSKAYTSYLQSEAKTNKLQMELLRKEFQMRFQLGQLRMHLQKPHNELAVQNGSHSFLELFSNHSVDDALQYEIPQEAYQHVHASFWGSKYTALLMTWLQSLQWPKSVEKTSSGISWFELAVNFMLTTQSNIPISVKQPDGTKRYVSTDEDPAFDITNFSLVDITNSFQGSWKHVRYLLQQKLYPEDQSVKARSLHQLGAGCFRQGLPRRPQLLFQQETMEIVQTYLNVNRHGGTAVFHAIPEIPVMAPIFVTSVTSPLDDTPKLRLDRYYRRRRDIRQS